MQIPSRALYVGLFVAVAACSGATTRSAQPRPLTRTAAPVSDNALQPVSIEGSRIVLQLPSSAQRIRNQPGWMGTNPTFGVSMSEQSWAIDDAEEFERGVLSGLQGEWKRIEEGGHIYHRSENSLSYMVFMRDEQALAYVLIHAEFPELGRAIALSVRLDSSRTTDPLAVLGVRMEVPDGMAVRSDYMPVAIGVPAPDAHPVIALHRIPEHNLDENGGPGQLRRELAANAAGFLATMDPRNIETRELRINGVPAVHIRARGTEHDQDIWIDLMFVVKSSNAVFILLARGVDDGGRADIVAVMETFDLAR